MNPTQIQQLKLIYQALQADNIREAKEIFTASQIVGSKEHLSAQYPIRHLIWNLDEFLFFQTEQYTDKEEIMNAFKTEFHFDKKYSDD